jgi:hypothetical protein
MGDGRWGVGDGEVGEVGWVCGEAGQSAGVETVSGTCGSYVGRQGTSVSEGKDS